MRNLIRWLVATNIGVIVCLVLAVGLITAYLLFSRIVDSLARIDSDEPIVTSHECAEIRVVDAEVRKKEEDNRIHAWVYIDGTYEDWPGEGPGNDAGYVTLQIKDKTWIWYHVWVGSDPPSHEYPIRVGDGFRPDEIGGSFVTALEVNGWEALTFALTIKNNCDETRTFLEGFTSGMTIPVTLNY